MKETQETDLSGRSQPMTHHSSLITHHSSLKVVAAIPCFNEERFIGSVVAKAKKYVDTVLVIDDGSTDDSAEIAERVGAIVYRHEQNRGPGAAAQTGLEQGQALHADIVVTLDGDGQHDPAEIPRLIEPILAGRADIVVGSRFLGREVMIPRYRRLGQRVLNAASNLGSGQRSTDSQSGYRAYSARALQELALVETGFSFCSELQFAASRAGLTLTDVPIDVRYDRQVKRNPVAHGVNVLARVATMFALRRPLLLFGVVGTVLLAAGLALGFWVLAKYQGTGAMPIIAAWTALILALSGLVIGFGGLIIQAMREVIATELAEVLRRLRRKQTE